MLILPSLSAVVGSTEEARCIARELNALADPKVGRARLSGRLRALLQSLAGARGHFTMAGTPERVAGLIEGWFRSGAADGFNVMPPILPSMLDVFVAGVVPILQRRGLFRREYQGSTLRAHYGLPRPPSSLFEPSGSLAAE